MTVAMDGQQERYLCIRQLALDARWLILNDRLSVVVDPSLTPQ